MINPFLAVRAGVFASIVGKSAPNLAESICAVLAARISSPPTGTSPLDQQWWTTAFNQLPLVSFASEVTGSVPGADAEDRAASCLSAELMGAVPTARKALAAWIDALPQPPDMLNSIAVAAGADKRLYFSLAFVDAQADTFKRTDAVFDSNLPGNLKQIQSVFPTEALGTETYFCRLN